MLIDQRKYTISYPKSNLVILTAIDIIENNKDIMYLDQVIVNCLKNQNDLLLNIAIQLSPNFETCNLIWNSILRVMADQKYKIYNNLLAIPIVLIAGSIAKGVLSNTISHEKLKEWFLKNNIFDSTLKIKINNNLLDYDMLSKTPLSEIFNKSRVLLNDDDFFTFLVNDNVIENEQVLIKYIIINAYDQHNINLKLFNSKLLSFAEFINKELSNDTISLLPIPFGMTDLLSAIHNGYNYCKEIEVTLKVTNFIRQTKIKQLSPYINVKSNDNTISISLFTKENKINNITIDWSLRKFDILDNIYNFINNLALDINVEINYVE